MQLRSVLTLILVFSLNFVFAQKKDWFDADFREKTYPSSIFYKEYAKGDSEKEAFNNAKKELSKSILTQIETRSTSTAITKDAIYNDLFTEKVSESSSATFVNLNKRSSRTRNKTYHVFIFKKKEELKIETKNIFNDLENSYINDVGSLLRIYNTGNLKQAKNKSDRINSVQRKLERLKTFLSIIDSEIDLIRLNDANQKFDELKAKILRDIDDEENYKSNKDKALLLFSSSDIEDLEQSLLLYKKAQKINPEEAVYDDLSADIEILRKNLFSKYCKNGLNSEQEKRYAYAIEYYEKARDLFPNKKVDLKNSTTDKIMFCQEENIKIIISQGDEELDDYPKLALSTYKDAKKLAIDMGNVSMIKPINKKIKRAESEIKKNIYKDQRKKSPNRILLNVGAGLQTGYSFYKDIFDKDINVDSKNWHLSTTLGYRTNLPEEKKTDNTGFETSKGNVLAVFFKTGTTNISELNLTNVRFNEIELGFISREKLRVSFGRGQRNTEGINNEYSSTNPSNYFCATGAIIMHFNRIAAEIGVTWLFNEDLEPLEAKINGGVKLKFYFLRKIYKKTKDRL